MPAYYQQSITAFLGHDSAAIAGQLSRGLSNDRFAQMWIVQVESWYEQISVLKATCRQLLDKCPAHGQWHILLEYPIPRRQKRVDTVILADDIIISIEFKVSVDRFDSAAIYQAEDYALDLRDFHLHSCGRTIVPIVVATDAPDVRCEYPTGSGSTGVVRSVYRTNSSQLFNAIIHAYGANHQNGARAIDADAWNRSAYRPVPTIIEAAQTVFASHDVRDISQAFAGEKNIEATTQALIGYMNSAKQDSKKSICFVTGVPGSGKTLCGLMLAHSAVLFPDQETGGAFLSGNGPLVRLLREALARDKKERDGRPLRETRHEVTTLIQNIHDFMREYGQEKGKDIPPERVIIFDEAQRAWNADQARRKFKRATSEPMMALDIMDRHEEWAMIVALVGGGQEIHDGEAGLAEWGRALHEVHSDWHITISPEALYGGPSIAGSILFPSGPPSNLHIYDDPLLHLDIPLRAYKAQAFTKWVNAVVAGDCASAAQLSKHLHDFPIAITRSLRTAKMWLREHTRGMRRCGLVASSGGKRLRAYGIEVSADFSGGYDYTHWFLDPRDDIRSSYQLEVAATEFECQGLELDWVGVCWANDFTWNSTQRDWHHQTLVGTKMRNVRGEQRQQYINNKYRVLLTRAREGIVIWVPHGNANDRTLLPEPLDETYGFLVACGVHQLET